MATRRKLILESPLITDRGVPLKEINVTNEDPSIIYTFTNDSSPQNRYNRISYQRVDFELDRSFMYEDDEWNPLNDFDLNIEQDNFLEGVNPYYKLYVPKESKHFSIDEILRLIQISTRGSYNNDLFFKLQSIFDPKNVALFKIVQLFENDRYYTVFTKLIKLSNSLRSDLDDTLFTFFNTSVNSKRQSTLTFRDITEDNEGQPTNGDIGDGFFSNWDPDTSIIDAIDDISEALEDIATINDIEAPASFPNQDLEFPTIGENYTVAHTNPLPGFTEYVSRWIEPTIYSKIFYKAYPAEDATFELFLNNSSEYGLISLTEGNDSRDNISPSGSNFKILRDDKIDKDFFETLDFQILDLPLTLGPNRVKLNLYDIGSTGDIFILRDKDTVPVNDATNSNINIVEQILEHSSGVPHLSKGSKIQVNNISVVDLVTFTYTNANPISYASHNLTGRGLAFDPKQYSFQEIIDANLVTTTNGIINANQDFSISNLEPIEVDNLVFSESDIHFASRNVNGASNITEVINQNVLFKNEEDVLDDVVYEDFVPVFLKQDINDNAGFRINLPNGDTPVYPEVEADLINLIQFDSVELLNNWEAGLVGGIITHNTIDYSKNYTPVGPNYNIPERQGAQYFTFAFSKNSVSRLSIELTGLISGAWISLPGVTSKYGESQWWSLTENYAGAGTPGKNKWDGIIEGETLDPSKIYKNKLFTVTFGEENSTNSIFNYIFIRFKLNPGDYIQNIKVLDTVKNIFSKTNV